MIDRFHIDENFPAVIRPINNALTLNDFKETLNHLKTDFQQLLLKHGALLFRGFPINEPNDFTNVIQALSFGKFVNYIGGDSPRNKVDNVLYTSTEAPPTFHIPLHQELSFIKHFPKHIYFYCQIPAEKRGATIIGDARKIYQKIAADIKFEFEEKNLTYVSRYHYDDRLIKWVNRSHKSWVQVFETNNKNDVEQKCIENDFSWQWLKKDWLEIKQTRPAAIFHPETNEKVWFNQAHLYDFNPRLLGYRNYFAATLFYLRKASRLHNITYADDSFIKREIIYHILDVLDKETVIFPWEKGDIMVLDNILTMHGREPFAGKRRILTTLTA